MPQVGARRAMLAGVGAAALSPLVPSYQACRQIGRQRGQRQGREGKAGQRATQLTSRPAGRAEPAALGGREGRPAGVGREVQGPPVHHSSCCRSLLRFQGVMPSDRETWGKPVRGW